MFQWRRMAAQFLPDEGLQGYRKVGLTGGGASVGRKLIGARSWPDRRWHAQNIARGCVSPVPYAERRAGRPNPEICDDTRACWASEERIAPFVPSS
jgi:hypothetical protein